jgi:hypothetical protein
MVSRRSLGRPYVTYILSFLLKVLLFIPPAYGGSEGVYAR